MGRTYLFAREEGHQSVDRAAVRRWLKAAALIGSAALVGFGIVLWIAANWDDIGKFGRFGVVSGAIVLSALLAAIVRPARVAGSLMGILGIGGLLALTGQTYQTGADPWQLFAMWAGLALPWAVAARHDAVWALWVAVAGTAIPLWGHAQVGPTFLNTTATALPIWLASIAICAALCPAFGLERWLGGTRWAFRLAVALALALVASTSLAGLFAGASVNPVYGLGLLLTVAIVVAFAFMAPFDLTLLAAAALSLDILSIAGIVRAVFSGRDTMGQMLLVGLTSAGVVAASAVALLRIAAWRRGNVVVPGDSPAGDETGRNWPVAVLSGIGAIMAATPLIGFLFAAFGSLLEKGLGTWVGAIAVIGGTIPWLRTAKPLGFGQQFGLISLAIGGLLMGMAAYRDLGVAPASLVMLAVAAGTAVLVPIGWLRGLLGATAAVFATMLIAQVLDDVRHMPDVAAFRLAWLLIAAAGASALLTWPHERGGLSSFVTGWSALALLGLMAAAGQAFLLGARLGLGTTLGTPVGSAWLWNGTRIISAACAIAGAGMLLAQRTDLRGPVGYGIAAVLVVLSAVMPSLGAAILLFAAAALTGRRTIALLAAIACLWIVSSFYYWLGWPLVQKAYLLIALGAALAAICWISGFVEALPAAEHDESRALRPALAAALIVASVAATAALVGPGVSSMERVLTEGRTVMIPLAPVDPRSLMQGDYMMLRFALPAGPDTDKALKARSSNLSAVVTIDQRGAGNVTALTAGKPQLGADQLLVALAWRGGRWALGTDGFFFKEGQAKRYAAAKFGVFRVARNGQALLTGLADAQLNPL